MFDLVRLWVGRPVRIRQVELDSLGLQEGMTVEWSTEQGARLRALREQGGFTQRQVSVALDVAQAAISTWERGEACPRRSNAVALGQLLGDVDGVLAICGYSSNDGRDLTQRVEDLERQVAKLNEVVTRLVDLETAPEAKKVRRRPK